MEPITFGASVLSAIFGGGLVAGVHRQKVSALEKDVENMEKTLVVNGLQATTALERLASVEAKCDLILTHLRPPANHGGKH